MVRLHLLTLLSYLYIPADLCLGDQGATIYFILVQVALTAIRVFQEQLQSNNLVYITINVGFHKALVFLSAFFVIIYIVFYVYYGSIFQRNLKTGREHTAAVYALSSQTEHELGAIEDYLPFLIYFIVFVAWFIGFTLFAHAVVGRTLHWVVGVWVGLILLTLVLPASVLTSFGLVAGAYIRGVGKGGQIVFECLLDLIAMLVVFIRFLIQNIRFVLIFLAYFELFEFLVIEFNTRTFRLIHGVGSWTDLWVQADRGITMAWCVSALWLSIYYFYYVLHLTVLVLAQFAIYMLLSFWLFFFLYMSFCVSFHEKSFIYRRYFNIEYKAMVGK